MKPARRTTVNAARKAESKILSQSRVPVFQLLASLRHRIRNWPIVPGVVLLTFVVMGVFAPLISPHGATEANLRDRRTPPVWLDGGTSKYVLGTDAQGRGILSRVIHGTRVSFSIAGSAIGLGMVFGTLYGLISGYYGGWTDEILMRIVEIFLAVPLIMVALVFIVVVGPSFTSVVSLLALFSWVQFARQVRGETLYLKASDYVALAKVSGASTIRILLRHIFPGVVNTVVVVATLDVGGLILTESSLSFLGVGIPPPTPSWGSMVSDGRNYLASSWWITFFPGMAIFVTVIGFNFLGDWLRDTLDPRLRQVG